MLVSWGDPSRGPELFNRQGFRRSADLQSVGFLHAIQPKVGVPGRGAMWGAAIWSARTCLRFPRTERSSTTLSNQPGLPTGMLGARSGQVDGCWTEVWFLNSCDKSPHSKVLVAAPPRQVHACASVVELRFLGSISAGSETGAPL